MDLTGYRGFLAAALVTLVVQGLFAAKLTLLPRLGSFGRWWSDRCARAPLLDIVVATLTFLPWLLCSIWVGWRGLLGSLLGQFVLLYAWAAIHELAHLKAARGPRINRLLSRKVGRLHNHLALWITVLSVPVFLLIRAAQIFVYPPLVWIVNLPRYRHDEWVNVSRHKFSGLVGHDLIWCLYCDWMTGVYSLGAEMLRNVESFWCPIRFYSDKKCDNCKLDFPDIDGGWVPADASMADVERLLNEKYAHPPHAWFGHPARLTVRGKAPAQPDDHHH